MEIPPASEHTDLGQIIVRFSDDPAHAEQVRRIGGTPGGVADIDDLAPDEARRIRQVMADAVRDLGDQTDS